METIISYIDNLFRNYPDTPQVQKARQELLGIMEDKYHELKAEGKSEHEAIGIVISEFGSMEEIALELELDQKPDAEQKSFANIRDEKYLTLEQAEQYIKIQERFGMQIAIGVAFCILSPTLAVLMSALVEGRLLSERVADVFGGISLFVMVAVGVGIFIISGIAHGRYEEYEKKFIRLDGQTKKRLTEQFEEYNTVFGIKIAAGVIFCIISVIPVIILEGIFEGSAFSWMENVSAVSLFAFVAIGVYFLITAGMKHGAYQTLLGIGKKKAAKTKQEKRIAVVSAIYWPIITVIYLGASFFTWNWGFTWIIWVISGIIFGGISAVITLLSGEE